MKLMKADFQRHARLVLEHKEMVRNTRKALATAFSNIEGHDPQLDKLIADVRGMGQTYCDSYDKVLSHIELRVEPTKK